MRVVDLQCCSEWTVTHRIVIVYFNFNLHEHFFLTILVTISYLYRSIAEFI